MYKFLIQLQNLQYLHEHQLTRPMLAQKQDNAQSNLNSCSISFAFQPLNNVLFVLIDNMVKFTFYIEPCRQMTFWFFKWRYIISISNNLQSNFWRNFYFACICVKKHQNRAFCIFLKIFSFCFPETVWKKNYCDTRLSVSNSISCKVLGLELLSKKLSTNWIGEFLKVVNIYIYSIYSMYT